MKGACMDKIESINLLADGMLAGEEADKLREHMSACDACQRQYDDICAVKRGLSGLKLEVPANLQNDIMAAVRNQKRTAPVRKMILRYATVAAACLAVVGMVFVYRAFIGGGMMKDSAEMDESAKLNEQTARFGETEMLTLDNSAGKSDGTEEAAAVPAPAEDDMTDTVNLDGYMYYTSAVDSPDSVKVNPDGLPLDSGYGGKQDIFYATFEYDISEILKILGSDYEIEMWGENESVLFYIDASRLKELEARLALMASETIEKTKGEVSVRIISLK